MMDCPSIFFGDRVLHLAQANEAINIPMGNMFVVLLPAFSQVERQQAEAIVGTLLDMGCVEFCCIGPEAEFLHDSIDGLIEDRQAYSVVTTGHADSVDGCEYFIFAAGGGAKVLLGLITAHPELVALVEKMARGE